jgi:hypothetical protein
LLLVQQRSGPLKTTQDCFHRFKSNDPFGLANADNPSAVGNEMRVML